LPELGGGGKEGEVIRIRIDFLKEQISMQREGGEPVVVAEGHGIGQSTFSLHAIMFLKG